MGFDSFDLVFCFLSVGIFFNSTFAVHGKGELNQSFSFVLFFYLVLQKAITDAERQSNWQTWSNYSFVIFFFRVFEKKMFDQIPKRYILCLFAFTGLIFHGIVRSTLAIAIVAMVKSIKNHSINSMNSTSDVNRFDFVFSFIVVKTLSFFFFFRKISNGVRLFKDTFTRHFSSLMH